MNYSLSIFSRTLVWILLLISAPLARAELVFNNSSNRLGASFTSPFEFGDEIFLGGSARTITNFVFYYFGTNFSGDEQARIRFYRTDGPLTPEGANVPQTVLYDSGFFAISNTTSTTSIALPRLKVTVPDGFVWSVVFSGVTNNEIAGLQLYSPPSIGSSFSDFWENGSGGWALRVLTSGQNADFGARIEATDSPSDNTAPFLSGFAPQTVPRHATAGPLAFIVGDLESPETDLTVSGISSDETLVPPGNIVFGGTGKDRTVAVTPAPNLSGEATITVIVTDPGGATDSQSFILRVGPPTISAILQQGVILMEDTPSSLISFVVQDLETAAENLTVSASSANTNLIPVEGIILGGSGSNRTLQFFPGTNQFGTTTVTVTVTDEIGAAATSVLNVEVTPVNDLPTLSQIADQTQGGVRFPFVVGDVETPAADLTVSASSSNPALVPVSGIVFGGSGSNRTVTVNPAGGQSGSARIGLTVMDADGGSASNSFLITLQANTLPVISKFSDVNAEGGKAIAPIAFTIGDAETPAANLTVTGNSSDIVLIPAENILFGGSGSNRTVTLKPATNQFGSAIISIVVEDGQGGIASETLRLTVVSTQQGPPVISLQPQDETRAVGEGVVFNVTAAGPAPLSYQWRFKGIDLPAQTNSFLALNNLSALHAGPYSVVISNPFGSTTSSNALLTITGGFRFAHPAISNGLFGFGLSGISGTVVIEISADLRAWVPIRTNSLQSTELTVTDSSPPTEPARFYRARVQP